MQIKKEETGRGGIGRAKNYTFEDELGRIHNVKISQTFSGWNVRFLELGELVQVDRVFNGDHSVINVAYYYLELNKKQEGRKWKSAKK